jgi:hypothetical protein
MGSAVGEDGGRRRFSVEAPARWDVCAICGEHQCDLFMVHDEVWAEVFQDDNGWAHVSCFEERLGRKLTPSDYTDAPCNEKWLAESRFIAACPGVGGDPCNVSARLRDYYDRPTAEVTHG